MGIRKKISLGFLCLGLMLAFSGMTSMFELRRMGRNTREVLESSSLNMELSRRMLDAVQDQNTALLQMTLLKGDAQDPLFADGRRRFDQALNEASLTHTDSIKLVPVYNARDSYYELVDSFFDETRNTDVEWFLETYRTAYPNLTAAIKDYMTDSQHVLMNKASQLGQNARRAMTPGIVSLLAAVVMVFMFAFLIDLYYTGPTVRITKGLKEYTAHNINFNVKVEGRDEVQKLREYIETLISMYKNKKA